MNDPWPTSKRWCGPRFTQPGAPALRAVQFLRVVQLFRIEEAGYGKSNQLRAGVEIQFSLDALPMRFDCLDAQVQRLRRFTRTHALAYHVQNLQFAVAQPVDGICRPPRPARGKL